MVFGANCSPAARPGDVWAPADYPSLRAVVFAGEVYPTPQLRELKRVLPSVDVWNLYGPTETNVCTYCQVGDLPEDDRTIPIGQACDNTQIFALKEDGTRAEIGEMGELFVSGPTVMKGYWGRPDKTEEVLVRNPLESSGTDLVYRTGDLVRMRSDGNYDFVGRRDDQIKSGVAASSSVRSRPRWRAHPDLEEVVAVGVPHTEWGTTIMARVVPKQNLRPAPRDVKRHVEQLVPRVMVAAAIEVVGSLPRTSNGKIDRNRILAEATVSHDAKR